MSETNKNGSGWIWGIIIIIIIIIILLLWWWAWPWSCTSCGTGNARGAMAKIQTFYITVAEKNDTHPNYNKGCNFGYVVDGVQGKSLTLKAGVQYRFMIKTDGFPFYIGIKEKGSIECTDIIEIPGIPTENSSFLFTPTLDMPQPLYYTCTNGSYLGSSIIIEK